MESPATQKQQLRDSLRLLLSKQDPADLEQESGLIISKLETNPEFQSAKTILLYYPLPDEVDTRELIQKWYTHKSILLPVVRNKSTMMLRPYTGENNLQVNHWGIKEPLGQEFTDYASIDLTVIPGLAFDQQGHRLGRGKAYYDRFLSKLQCPIIGLCFACCYLETLPVDPWDMPIHKVISKG